VCVCVSERERESKQETCGVPSREKGRSGGMLTRVLIHVLPRDRPQVCESPVRGSGVTVALLRRQMVNFEPNGSNSPLKLVKHASPTRHRTHNHSRLLRRTVKRFRGGLVLKAHRLLYYSTLGLRVIKKKRRSTHAGILPRVLINEPPRPEVRQSPPHGGVRPCHQKSTC